MASLVMTGAAELQQMTRDLTSEGKHGKKVFRKGLRAGAKVVAQDVNATFPEKSGKARRSVKVRGMKRKKGRIGVRVALFAQADKGRWKEAPYPYFQEKGTKKHNAAGKRVRKVYRSGERVDSTAYDAQADHVAPGHYVEKSLARTGAAAEQTILQTCVDELEKLSLKR